MVSDDENLWFCSNKAQSKESGLKWLAFKKQLTFTKRKRETTKQRFRQLIRQAQIQKYSLLCKGISSEGKMEIMVKKCET